MANKAKSDAESTALSASAASINTVSVTIKTLRVGTRQCTQAVFRQLPIQEFIDQETVELKGRVWGWINYNPDGLPEEKQFIYQHGNTLCRCPFYVRDILELDTRRQWPAPFERLYSAYQSAAENWILARAVEGMLEFDPIYVSSWGLQKDQEPLTFTVHEHPEFRKFYIAIGQDRVLNSDVLEAVQESVYPHWLPKQQLAEHQDPADAEKYRELLTDSRLAEQRSRNRKRLSKLLAKRTNRSDNSPATILASMADIAQQASSYIRRWNTLMSELRGIEQLYIAV
jgi:hypothetical protein